MSNPSRQTTNRRLPPLQTGKRGPSPGTVKSGRYIASPSSVPTRCSPSNYNHDMIITSMSNGRSGRQLGDGIDDRLSPPEMFAEQVRHFLGENPSFLEEYLMTNISLEQMEKWTHHKRSQPKIQPKPGDKARPQSNKKWTGIGTEKRHMLQEMIKNIHQYPNKPQVLIELVNSICSVIGADGSHLFIFDDIRREIYLFKGAVNAGARRETYSVGSGSVVAAYVAETKLSIRLDDINKDDRFPDGLGGESQSPVQAVLCHPVTVSSGELIGVVEFYRSPGCGVFTSDDVEIADSYLVWGGIALYFAERANVDNQMYHTMTKQKKLNEFLLAVTKSIFQDIVSMDTVIMKIMNYAQKLVNADRASLFLVDNKTNELYARIFDVGNGQGATPVSKDQKEIRFPMNRGIAGHVSSTGDTLNITDAYEDDRFNRDVDSQTGYRTKSILCMPIYIRGSIIGVVQMVNKLTGTFTKADEQSFETFAIYCGLALHHAKLYDKIRRSEQKYRVAVEVLSYHSTCTDGEFKKLQRMPIPDPLPDIARYDFDPWNFDADSKPLYVLCMFKDLFSLNRFDMESLMRFTLTVRKNYRRVPYHNWQHAFSVAHSMYCLMKYNTNVFTGLESLALFVACLCHDLDHRGKTNAFMVKNATPLATIYTTSTMEHHHFNQTITILQQDGHNIFKNLSSDEYKEVLSAIKHAILATDLALFFGNRAQLQKIVEDNHFSWDSMDHRCKVRALCMTASDLGMQCKPFLVTKQVSYAVFDEFCIEGDEEKRQGIEPIPMMDRDRAHELPANQVGFVAGICVPCTELLAKVLPGSKAMYDGAVSNLQNWSALVAKQKDESNDNEKDGT